MNKKIILLAEDNPDDALLTIHALKEATICNEIEHVADGVEALDYLFARGKYTGRDPASLPALLLLDINMPKVNGLQVLREVRANAVTKHLRVVILTTSREEQDVIASYDLGANSYVRKPVDFDEFTSAARNLGIYWLLLNEQPNQTYGERQ
jgi:CheY-like chemotaxis protein